MEPAPLPPHERPWRHPSEVAAHTSALLRAEPASSSARTVALLGGTAGVLLIGLVVLAVTPRDGSPTTAMSVTTIGNAFGNAAVAPVVLSVPTPRPTHLPPAVLATPIGDDGLAVAPRDALALLADEPALGARVPVRLSTDDVGRTVTAAVVHDGGSGGLAVLALGDTPIAGLPVARQLPDRHDEVTVLADPPVATTFGRLDQLDIEHGAAVVDDDGHLVGLCADEGADGDGVIPIDARLVDASAPAD